MATWTNIPDSNIEPGKPIRSIDGLALRDNPIAIAEGASGAPRIEDAALDTTVTSAGTDWVLARTAGASVGAVGTYALLGRSATDGQFSLGQTLAGSGLRYFAARSTAGSSFSADLPTGTTSAPYRGNGGTPAGTWRAMCNGNGGTGANGGVFLRIS